MASFTNHTGLTVTSVSFKNNGLIPTKFTCEGEDINPALQIGNIPSGAKSLALILQDPDAPMKGGFTHWVMWNMPTDGAIPENYKGAEQGMNSARKMGYYGMCPPSGTHHYLFKVYALDTKPELPVSTDKAALEMAMKGHILAEGELTGLYKKVK